MTIYLEERLKRSLLELSAEESKKKGKRVGMAEMIRKAVVEYLKRKGVNVEDFASVINRMLLTRGTVEEDFKKRIKGLQKEFKKWKI